MSQIFGHLNISDSDRVFNSTVGQRAIFDAATEYVNRVNAELQAAMAVFVERTTEEYKLRYKLPGGGYLQVRQPDGSYQAVKVTGQWDVAFPLRDYGAQIAGNDVDMRYMTVAELDRHIQTVTIQNVNTVRFFILKALLNNNQVSFADPLWGTLLVEPLANNDATLYPPVIGATAEAQENHYYGANYAVASISASNNPLPGIVAELEEHFGITNGASNIVVFVDPTATPYLAAISGYVPIYDPKLNVSALSTQVGAAPSGLPGITRGRLSGAWVQEWRWMPTRYMLGIDMDQPKPLIRRIDPADTGLGDGLQLVATATPDEAEVFPFNSSIWRHRFGLGVGNRLNGVAVDVTTSTSYTVPTAYA